MGFQQGLSGLNLSSKALDAIGNNVANSNTVGFKSAQAHFADVYAASLVGGGGSGVGIGGSVTNIAQQFTQGNVTATNNALDLAVNGGGFFRMSDSGNISYSRAGQFQVDKNGYIVNGSGLRVTGYAADTTGAIVPGNFVDLQMSNTNIEPTATTASQVQINLDSRSAAPTAMTHGTLTGSVTPANVIITAANNSFQLRVDGYPTAAPVTIYVPIATYADQTALAAAVQTAINSNPTIVAQNTLVDATLENQLLVVKSRSAGSVGSKGLGSSIEMTVSPTSNGATTATNGLLNLMGADPLPAANAVNGVDNFDENNTLSYTGSTAQTIYDSLGNAHNLTMYFVKSSQANTWQTYTSLDGTFTGNTVPTGNTAGTLTGTAYTSPTVAVDAGGTLNLTVDGVAQTITIRDSVTAGAGASYSATELATEISSRIAAAFGSAVATADGSTGAIALTSATIGGSSSVTVAAGTLAIASVFGTATAVPGQPLGTALVPTAATMSFTSAGALATTTPLSLTYDMTNGATSPLEFTLDFGGSSQYGLAFGVNQLLQDGYSSGRLSGLSVSADGVIQGRYSNGKSRNMGQLVLANFNNSNGLQSLGGNQWAETAESGQPIPGTPGAGSLGVIQSAAVEESNVDLTAELVNMITQQRVYQANAQTIKTQDQVLQTLVNLR